MTMTTVKLPMNSKKVTRFTYNGVTQIKRNVRQGTINGNAVAEYQHNWWTVTSTDADGTPVVELKNAIPVDHT